MAKDKKTNKENRFRGSWDGRKLMQILYRVWMVIFAAAKIAIGAACTVLLIGLVCCFVLMGILGDYLESDILPSAGLVLENYDMDEPSYIYCVDSEGEIELLQKVHSSTDWKNAEYEDIPEALIHAAVAIEDKRFYEHQGVDWVTTIKAFANMFFGDKTVGGSSITQQLIKNRTGEDSVTVQRKVMEFFRASLVEKNYDKNTIMEMYMNSIYLGQGCRGVRSAAETYFGKELQTLTIAECASLISITNNPSLFDPYSTREFMYQGEMMNGMQRNRHRQMLVLGEMLKQGWITQEEYDEAVAQEIVLKNGIDPQDVWVDCTNEACDYEGATSTYTTSGEYLICPECAYKTEIASDGSQIVYSYFVDTLLEDLAKELAVRDGVETFNKKVRENYMELISKSGYHIYATIDPDVQAQVDKIYKDLKQIPDTRSAQQLQSAIVVIDNRTGDIVAMSGGVGDEKVHDGQNRAVDSRLQSGSSIKPLTIYAPGFENGKISPATVIKDLPLTYDNGAWPANDTRTYSYSRTVYKGIEDSVNAVAANTLKLIGDSYGFEFAKNSFGLETLKDPEDLNFASLALGAQHYGITVKEMACAFATFPNGGVRREGRTFTKVYDSKGNLIVDNTQDSFEVLSEKAVTYTNYCLSNAVAHGTGGGASFGTTQVAGKTGTSSRSRDRWFCGYTSYYTAAVWCGYDWPESINLGYNPAARLWRKVMEPIHKGLKYKSLYSTGKMTKVVVCLDSGMLATDACKCDVRGGRTEEVFVYPEDVPTKSCTKHVQLSYCTTGGGVANDFCKYFADAGAEVKLENKALVKLSITEYQQLLAAKRYGLEALYLRDDYIYLTNTAGADMDFNGINGDINVGVTAPYKVCQVHNANEWDKYQSSQPAD